MDPNMYSMMPYYTIGFFVILAIIIIPLVIIKASKGRKKANNFFPDLAQRTGLQLTDNGLSGNYKGYQLHFQYKMSGNVLAGYNLLTSGNSNVWGKNTMFPTMHVEVQSEKPFPQLAIYDPPGAFMQTHQFLQDLVTGKKPGWEKLDIDGSVLRRGINLYGDATAAQKTVQSQELRNLLGTWKYTDIRMEGNKLKLVLDNNSAPSTIGLKKMYSQEFVIQALDIAVTAAKAVQ